MSHSNLSLYDFEEISILQEISNEVPPNETIWEHTTIVESCSVPHQLFLIFEILEENFVMDSSNLNAAILDDDGSINFENSDEISSGLSSEIIETLSVSAVTDTSQSCSICLENYKTDELLTILPCIHSFHKLCLDVWIRSHTTCPICRETIRA